jgi:hypothetical protein
MSAQDGSARHRVTFGRRVTGVAVGELEPATTPLPVMRTFMLDLECRVERPIPRAAPA